MVPYGLDRVDPDHENGAILGCHQGFRLGGRGKDGCPGVI